jgi:hypothetical protein
MLVDLPSDMELQTDNGPDFTIYSFQRRDDAAAQGHLPTVISIYVGTAPKITWPSRASKVPVKQGSRVLVWHFWRDPAQGLFHNETLIKDFFSHSVGVEGVSLNYLQVHIFIAGPDADLVKQLGEDATSLRLAEKS